MSGASTRYDVAVIGAGANGLAAATALARQGRSVVLLEAASQPGGQGRPVQVADGYSFAPAWFEAGWLAPFVASATGLKAAGADIGRYTSVVDADGALVSLGPDASRTNAALRRRSPADAASWGAFARRLHNTGTFLEKLYSAAPPDAFAATAGELFRLAGLGATLRGMGRDGMVDVLRMLPMSVDELARDAFVDEAVIAAICSVGVRGIQQGPRSSGTAFVLLHNLVGAAEGVLTRGDTMADRTLIDQLLQAALSAGVSVRAGTAARRIRIADYRAVGVDLDQGALQCSSVLSAVDPRRTMLELVEPEWLDPDFRLKIANIRARGCTVYVLLGIDGLPEFRDAAVSTADSIELLSGIISLSSTSSAIEKAADAAKYGELAVSPHIEVSVPSLRYPGTTPQGKHLLVARVHFAAVSGPDASERAGQATLAALDSLFAGLSDRIQFQRVLDPEMIQAEWHVSEGALTHAELMLDQVLFMRPVPECAAYATPLPGLYMGSAGSHPGPGLPGAAGVLAARSVLREA